MDAEFTEKDFERLSWHDNYIYGFHFSIGDFEAQDWSSDLVLDIDYIIEWLCGVDRSVRFKISPATLTFHNVTDLRINIEWEESEYRIALHEISISKMERERIENQKICLDRPYYKWLIETNFPKDGEISFGASGFTQVLRAEPIISGEQKLTPSQRKNPFPGE